MGLIRVRAKRRTGGFTATSSLVGKEDDHMKMQKDQNLPLPGGLWEVKVSQLGDSYLCGRS